MKKIVITFCLFFTVACTFSQQFYFPNKLYGDSAAMANALPGLAKQVIAVYNEPDSQTYYNTLLRLQIVAEQYDDALKSINSLRATNKNQDSLAAGINFQYETYVFTKKAQIKVNESFEKIYPKILNNLYNKLPEKAIPEAEAYFNSDIKEDEFNWYTLNNRLKVENRDSIGFENAKLLCRTFNIYNVYRKIIPVGKPELQKLNDKKFIVEDSILIPMLDGAKISVTIVRRKDITEPQPVVLMYNIYAGSDISEAKRTTIKGFAGVIVNTRGKRLSPQEIEPFEHDADDAYEIIDWLSKQPWCNGKIGMYGGSYLGFSQWAAVKKMHPALKTIVPQVAVGAGIDYPMLNGVFMNYSLQWLHYVMDNKLTADYDFSNTQKWNNTFGSWYKKGASFRSLDTLEGRPNKIFQRWLQHPNYDSYWQNMTPQKEEFAKINIPILATTGYYDDDQLGAMYYYKQYQQWNKNPDYYLIIGPYDHGGAQAFPKKELGGYIIDSVANIPILDIIFQWFDHVLKDSSLPAILKDKVNFEVMGTNEWQHVSSLDKMHNDSLILYLGNSPNGKQYPLLPASPTTKGFINQKVDFTDRTEMRFKEGDIMAFNLIIDSVLTPEKEKLIFVSEPVEKPFAISGSLTASIVISINKKDFDLVLDLYEQTPDGKYFALNETLQRVSYAKDRTNRQLLEPNKIENIVLNNTFITSKQLQKGSRIIVTIGVNKSPSWQINYGTGKDVSDETIKDGAIPMQLKWYNTSYIKLPILK